MVHYKQHLGGIWTYNHIEKKECQNVSDRRTAFWSVTHLPLHVPGPHWQLVSFWFLDVIWPNMEICTSWWYAHLLALNINSYSPCTGWPRFPAFWLAHRYGIWDHAPRRWAMKYNRSLIWASDEWCTLSNCMHTLASLRSLVAHAVRQGVDEAMHNTYMWATNRTPRRFSKANMVYWWAAPISF